jgi:alpha-beta hydrolase superfamily lysophospholipase
MLRTLFLLAVPAVAAIAQSPDRASFLLVSGADTVIIERFTRGATAFSGEFADRARGGRMTYAAELTADGLISRLTTQFFRSDADTVGESASFVIGGDSMIARLGNAAPAHLPSAVGALPLVNPSVAFLEQLLIRARAADGPSVTIPIFIIGAPQPMSATVSWVGADSAVLQYAGATMRLAVSREGRILGGALPAQGVTIKRTPVVEGPITAVVRDYSAPRGAAYTAENVVIKTRAGIKLAGTLTIPRGRVTGRAPAIVTISGSGPEDRDGEPSAIRGYRPFRELADTLGTRGFAVLRLDDRGVGGSDPGPRTVTSNDFADDIATAIAYLRTRSEIDPTRLGVVGHSEGAMIAAMVAKNDGQLRGIALLGGTASLGRDILLSQQHYVVDTMMKLTGKARDTALARYQRNTDSVAKATPWLKFFLEYEPQVLARHVETPVLILQGETDHQVPASEAERLATAFRTSGNRSVTVQLFPETNHLFLADATGGFDYAKLPSLRVRPEVLGAIADWLTERFR